MGVKSKSIEDIEFEKLEVLMEKFNLNESVDYIGEVHKDIKLSGKDKGVSSSKFIVRFREEENKEVIKSLKEIGWKIEKRYKNSNGSPSIFCSDEHSRECYGDFKMIRMKKII